MWFRHMGNETTKISKQKAETPRQRRQPHFQGLKPWRRRYKSTNRQRLSRMFPSFKWPTHPTWDTPPPMSSRGQDFEASFHRRPISIGGVYDDRLRFRTTWLPATLSICIGKSSAIRFILNYINVTISSFQLFMDNVNGLDWNLQYSLPAPKLFYLYSNLPLIPLPPCINFQFSTWKYYSVLHLAFITTKTFYWFLLEANVVHWSRAERGHDDESVAFGERDDGGGGTHPLQHAAGTYSILKKLDCHEVCHEKSLSFGMRFSTHCENFQKEVHWIPDISSTLEPGKNWPFFRYDQGVIIEITYYFVNKVIL